MSPSAAKSGDYRTAISLYTQLLEKSPRDAKLLSNRSACLARLGSHNEALADADKVIYTNPWKACSIRLAQTLFTPPLMGTGSHNSTALGKGMVSQRLGTLLSQRVHGVERCVQTSLDIRPEE